MTLRRAMSMGAVQMAAGMAISFVSIKITARYLGTEGVGVVGNLSLVASLAGCLSGGAATGIVRRMGEFSGDPARVAFALSSVARLLLMIGIPLALVMAVIAPYIATAWVKAPTATGAVLLFTVVYVFGQLGAVFGACSIGAKDYVATTTATIALQFVSFVATASLSVAFGIAGGLYAAALTPLLTLAVWYVVGRRRAWWPRRLLAHGFSWAEARATLSFVPKALVSSIGVYLLPLLINDFVQSAGGDAGMSYVRSANRLTDMMMTICGGLFTMYFLPRFSEIQQRAELRRELVRTSLLIVPAMGVMSLGLYVWRDGIIAKLWTDEFLPMRDLMGWQMAGIVLKTFSWIFAFVLLAKLPGRALALLEASTLIAWWALAKMLIGHFGVVGAPMAFCCTYGVYAVVVGLLVMRVMRRMP